ncbi:hypothetical protein [Virgibacillus sp. Bac330]|uniref:hypothetical protein n=1 Tax=Virgibacillus sp. Bac330 TaxID=2419841 RepID=UPI000EF46E77|nr:hypothetical protein [Virgibacillus sp. Bac330]
MMPEKVPSYYLFTRDTKNKIKQIAEENKCSEVNAITRVIDIYIQQKEEQQSVLLDAVSQLMDEKLGELKESLHRLQVTGNVIDRDTKMILEFWNHYFVVNKFQNFISTEKFKTDEVKEAETLIKDRISKHRQRRLEWEQKKQAKQ